MAKKWLDYIEKQKRIDLKTDRQTESTTTTKNNRSLARRGVNNILYCSRRQTATVDVYSRTQMQHESCCK